jgi:hypothetical protein
MIRIDHVPEVPNQWLPFTLGKRAHQEGFLGVGVNHIKFRGQSKNPPAQAKKRGNSKEHLLQFRLFSNVARSAWREQVNPNIQILQHLPQRPIGEQNDLRGV